MTPQLYIATNGLGVWTSDDLGESLVRMNSRAGMYSGYHIWAFANDPADSERSASWHEWRALSSRQAPEEMVAHSLANG